jgi:signal transduction histidine kinase
MPALPEPTSQTAIRRHEAGDATWAETAELVPSADEQLARLRSAARAFAHEIRNPLNGAQLHVTFLQRELLKLDASADALEAAGVIASEIQRVAMLVTQFLESSQPPSRARVSLRALCLRALQLSARDAERAGVEVGTELESADCTVEVDLSQMEQVLLHLLQRAIEGALEGGGRVIVRARRDAQDALIEVKHNSKPNPMLAEALLARADAQSPNLNLALRIVADHGGTIEVTSAPDRTEFRVKVPLQRQRSGG